MYQKRQARTGDKFTTDKGSHSANINWFPGHMTRTKRKIEQNLKMVDIVAEIVDARVPDSSRNPVLDDIVSNKPRIVILNKCDMANDKKTTDWIKRYNANSGTAISIDCKSGKGLEKFVPCVKDILSEKIQLSKKKGIINKSIKVMVVGIPNVGKSSFINKISKSAKAKVEDRPGVTRGNQWFSAGNGIDILDTPGVLWPKFDDQLVGEKLAFCGAIKDEVLDTEYLAVRLLELLKNDFAKNIIGRYKLNVTEEELKSLPSCDILELIGKKRGMLLPGSKVDTERAANILLDEFRSAKLGNITLD